jgi:hypothetical protein
MKVKWWGGKKKLYRRGSGREEDGWSVVADRVTRHQVHFPGGLSNWKGDKRKEKGNEKSVYGCMRMERFSAFKMVHT